MAVVIKQSALSQDLFEVNGVSLPKEQYEYYVAGFNRDGATDLNFIQFAIRSVNTKVDLIPPQKVDKWFSDTGVPYANNDALIVALDELLGRGSTSYSGVLVKGVQPDGDIVAQKADGEFFNNSTPLAAGAEFTSAWYDHDGFGSLEFYITADVPSASKGIIIEYSSDVNVPTPVVLGREIYEFTPNDVRRNYKEVHIRPKLDGFRLRYINGSEPQSDVFFAAVGRLRPETGILNSGNALVAANYSREVALGNISNYTQNTKFGRNNDVDTAQAADIWGGGRAALGIYDYTGFNATANENLSTVSSDINDTGALVSSGTITTNAAKQVIDTGATFITDGVAIGDIVLNDSRGTHGFVTSIDSETQLTVFLMQDGSVGNFDNIAGNSYRVATATGTGAAVVVWKKILNHDLEVQGEVFVILNGTTPVVSTVDAYRCSRGAVLLAGSSGTNLGEITVNQAITTANVFGVMPIGAGQTLICADTVPKDEVFLLETIACSMSISGGGAASAVVSLRVRPRYSVFQTRRIYELSSGGGDVVDAEEGGVVLQQGTDFKMRVDSVSANNSRVSARMEYLEIDEV